MARVQVQLFDWQEFVNPPPHKIFVWDKHGTYQDCMFPNPVHGHFLGGKRLKGKRIPEVLGQGEAKILLGVIGHSQSPCLSTTTAG